MSEAVYPIWFDKTNWRVLAPHLQKAKGGTESVVARLFCYRSYSSEFTPAMELGRYTEHELRILANVARHNARKR